MNPTRRNLLASSGMLVSVAALRGASPVLADQVTPPPKTKKTDTTRDPFEQLKYQRAVERNPYIDIRDYGTFTDGGDIGPALQAALTANIGDMCPRIRIPNVGTGRYSCSTVMFPAGRNAPILEIDCRRIRVRNTWSIPGGYTLIGTRFKPQNLPIPYGPWQDTTIEQDTPNGFFPNPTVELAGQNIWVENLAINAFGTALHCNQTELYTLRRLVLGSDGSYPYGPLVCTNTFWGQFDNIFCQPSLTGQYAITFNTDLNIDKNNGIMIMKNVIITRNGILFRSVFGPSGVDNTTIDRIHSESLLDGNCLINFDSTANGIGGIEIINPEMSDSLGMHYLIHNTGSHTDGVVIRGFNRGESERGPALLSPTSDPIRNLVIDFDIHDIGTATMPTSLAKTYAAGPRSWQLKTSSAIDCKLLSAPVGLPWLIYTPIAVNQDPAEWTNAGGATITTGVLAPDGSTMAGKVSGGSGARAYQNNITYALGDWLIGGVWIRDPNGGKVHSGSFSTGIEVLGGSGTFFSVNNGTGTGGMTGELLHENMLDNGWVWCCNGFKITGMGSFINPGYTRFRLAPDGIEKEFFNPCMMIIPASAGYDDPWIVNFIRSTKGGWSSTGARGDVTILDHQTLKAGAFKATAKTFATLPRSPVAGMQAYITDCNTATWGAIAAGGGSSKVMIWYNGSNWTVMGK
jgi:hypothetical protein